MKIITNPLSGIFCSHLVLQSSMPDVPKVMDILKNTAIKNIAIANPGWRDDFVLTSYDRS